MKPLLRITVLGTPAPQGSKKFVGEHNGRPLMAESSKKVGPWRRIVTKTARQVMAGAPPLDGPLVAVMTFTLPKPVSAPKTRRTWPIRYPDGSKLLRSTEDALTDAGVWADDARAVSVVAHKRYPNEGRDALQVPGVVIEVYPADVVDVTVQSTPGVDVPMQQRLIDLEPRPISNEEFFA